MWRFITLLLVFLTTALCLKSFFLPEKKNQTTKKSSNLYQLKLADSNSFQALSGSPLVAKYNGVSTVKVVYDLKSKKLYYINSNVYTYHFDFCEDILGFQGGLTLFNQTNYTETSMRKYGLANLNYYPTLNSYGLEFVTEDEISPNMITAIYKKIQETSYIKNKLFILVNGELLKQAVPELQPLPLLYPNDIYASLSYQCIVTGDAYGKLVFISSSKDIPFYQEDCIYVLQGSPLFIPTCQGIITDQFQTPLSHIQVLTHNKRMPCFAYKEIWNKSFQELNNSWVHVRITTDSFFIQKVEENVCRNNVRIGKQEAVKLEADTTFRAIQPLASFKYKDKNKIGNKAANLYLLEKLSKENRNVFNTPAGSFAIPFYYYQQHISDSLIKTQLDYILKSKSTLKQEELKFALKTLRNLILAKKMDPVCLKLVEAAIRKQGNDGSYRFRSSSNAEDAPGFSGAGLYSSKTGILGDSMKSIELAIKKVWASTWSFEAFITREQAHIVQDGVMMAILCHQNFPEEEANGVVVTKNIYRPSFPGFTVNAQTKELSVVQPDSNIQCDQFTMFKPADFNPFTDDIAVDYIAYGNQNMGKPVLSIHQIQQLYKAIAVCDEYFAQFINSSVSYDIEFKFDDGKLFLKQIRPYF